MLTIADATSDDLIIHAARRRVQAPCGTLRKQRKTTVTKRLQAYGFTVADCENMGGNLQTLQKITSIALEHGSSSVAFGACFPRYLARAPPGVVRFLLLPEKEVYTRRWQNRNPSDTQSHDELLEEAVNVSKAPSTRVVYQPVDECVDQTVWRMCNELKRNPEPLNVGAERRRRLENHVST